MSIACLLFHGQYADVETGLYYNLFLYYSPELGNYISQAPIRIAGNNPDIVTISRLKATERRAESLKDIATKKVFDRDE